MPIQYETLTQAAERTGISRVTLRRRIASGHLVAYRGGARLIRVRPEDAGHLLSRSTGRR